MTLRAQVLKTARDLEELAFIMDGTDTRKAWVNALYDHAVKLNKAALAEPENSLPAGQRERRKK